MNGQETLSHESFGQIRFARVNGGNTTFYGSELPQDHYIVMELYQSEIHRDLTQDRYHNKGQVISLRMTSGQFSEMITSLNIGSGVPCTIERIQGKHIEKLPQQESRKEFMHRNFEDRMKEFAVRLKEKQKAAKDLVAKKSLTKEEQRDLNFHLEWLTREIESNIPFFAKCFQETMDNVVFEAKLEIENAIQHKINVLGLEVLHNENKLLDK